jgi:putative membrane protein
MKKTYLAVALALTTLLACNSGTSSNTADSTTSTDLTSDSSNLMSEPGSTASSMTDSSAAGAASSAPLNDMDKQFAMDAAKGGNTEVAASQMAQNSAQNQRVKDFAAMMINDHTKANQELMSLTSRKGLTLPDSTDPKKKDALQSLQKMSGANFDKQYMTQMVKDHQETVNKFQMATQKCEDSDLKTWAAGKLPALKMHLDSAQAIQKSLK